VAKDRARPFSRKHARYWLTAAGGMVVIMVANVVLGLWLYCSPDPTPPAPQYQPIPAAALDAGVPLDAQVAAGAAALAAPDAGP